MFKIFQKSKIKFVIVGLGNPGDKYTFTPENTEDILKDEIGKTFVRVLEDAGVYKCTSEGRNAFLRFVSVCGGHKK